MKYIIDRIEENTAILESYDGDRLNIEKTRLPKEAQEGTSVEINENGVITVFVDEERRKRIAEKMKKVWR